MTSTTTNGGSSSDTALDDVLDGHEVHAIDPQRTKAAIHHLQSKIHKTMELISAEQAAKEGKKHIMYQCLEYAEMCFSGGGVGC